MKRLILILVILNFYSVSLLYAQGMGALPTMTMQSSLPLVGAGAIGVAKPNNDPLGFYFNPAMLGYSSQNNHLSLFFMPTKVKWIPAFGVDLTKNTYGFNVGYNFNKKFSLPISVGFGYMHDKFDYGTFTRTGPNSPEPIGTFESYDIFDTYSLGIGIDYYLKFNLGASIKPFDSRLEDSPTSREQNYGKAKGTAFDYGVMVIAPISELLFNHVKYQLCEDTYLKPNVDFTLGYTISNIGDEISYFYDKTQSDPLSRTGRLGYTFDFGFDAYVSNTKINLFSYSFSAEVNDILIKVNVIKVDNGHGGYSSIQKADGYKSALGDIDVWDNLVLLNYNDKTVLHKGHTFTFLETFTLTSGGFRGAGYNTTVGTSGYGVSSEGIFKLINGGIKNSFLKYLTKYFVIEWYDVTLFKRYNGFDTDMIGISLHMKNLEF